MQIKPEDLTKEESLDQILEIIKENPDNVNPRNSRKRCVYEDPDGNHCLIGKWFSIYYPEILDTFYLENNYKIGVTASGYILYGAYCVFRNLGFKDDVADFAGEIQGVVDLLKKPQSWKDLEKYLNLT